MAVLIKIVEKQIDHCVVWHRPYTGATYARQQVGLMEVAMDKAVIDAIQEKEELPDSMTD